ncbi:hypothetical protein NDN08_001887 [Rhodosorus marinus]|uniref:AB hydrolase-1 domain-containing protein n=1 Tax=Rhodosorus marinus TaxID=101924 RepID=A0AAV8US38_9RHOD|nr:hypothetical protein NDN08_001887 [Rhodosorus marinus]
MTGGVCFVGGVVAGRPAAVKGRCSYYRESSATFRLRRTLMRVSEPAVVAENTGRLQRNYEDWSWNGYKVNVKSQGPEDAKLNVLLVHGFGASVNHWFELQQMLADSGLRVHAVDLLGFGASDKPVDVEYSIELWSDMLSDLVREKGGQWIVSGNSVGSLAALDTANKLGKDFVSGICLFNCAGGLTAFRYSELSIPIRVLYFMVRKIFFNPILGRWFFDNYRSKSNIESILLQVYGNKDAVTDELVEMLFTPSEDENASSVFLKVLDGPPGPTPESLLQKLSWCPSLAIWGQADPWTPVGNENGMNFHPGCEFPEYHPNFQLFMLNETGHCPHDERPEECRKLFLDWIEKSVSPKTGDYN